MFRLTKLNSQIKRFSTQRVTDILDKSKYSFEQLNPVEILLKGLSSTILFPFGFCSVSTNHVLTYYMFGKYSGYRTSGLVWIPPLSNFKTTFCGDITLNQKNMHLTDLIGNPLIVNTFVIYNITNPVNNVLNLLDTHVLDNWIENTVRHVISSYTYEQLTTDTTKENFMNLLVKKLNEDTKAELYGIQISKAGILQINYAPEIAETMLVKQKAKATIEARKELVDATLHLIDDIGNKLSTKLTPEDKSKLITCLTVSMIGSQSPSQVINLN